MIELNALGFLWEINTGLARAVKEHHSRFKGSMSMRLKIVRIPTKVSGSKARLNFWHFINAIGRWQHPNASLLSSWHLTIKSNLIKLYLYSPKSQFTHYLPGFWQAVQTWQPLSLDPRTGWQGKTETLGRTTEEGSFFLEWTDVLLMLLVLNPTTW